MPKHIPFICGELLWHHEVDQRSTGRAEGKRYVLANVGDWDAEALFIRQVKTLGIPAHLSFLSSSLTGFLWALEEP